MQMTRKERQLQLALEEKVARKRLVHSKHLGWLAVGMTSFALGVVGFTAVGTNQTVSASTNDKGAASQVVVPQTNTSRAWTLRPVSEIKAQFQASDKKTYDIKWGDTLSTISEALNESGFTTSVDRLAEINHIANIDLIYAGAKLYLQGSGDNATVTTKDNHGNEQTYNLNPAKPAVASPSDKAAASAATPSKTGTSEGKATVASGQTYSSKSTSSATSTKPSQPSISDTSLKPSKPSTPVTPVQPSEPTKPAEPEQPSEPAKPITPSKNTNRSVTVNKDEQGNLLSDNPDLSQYHQLSSIDAKNVQTLTNGDTVTTTTRTVTYHKIVRTTQNVVHNVDENGNELASTNGLIFAKRGTTYKDVVADNGDVTTIITTTNVYMKSPTTPKTAAITIKYVDADTGDSIKPNQISTDTVGNVFKASAPVIQGYTLNGDGFQTITVSAEGNTILFSYKKSADIHDTSKYVTKNIDENGNILGDRPDPTKYHKISESGPVKSDFQKLPNGDTVTTYLTTVTYHEISHTTKRITVNVDENNVALQTTEGYDLVKSSDVSNDITAANGDVVTTITTTNIYRKHEVVPTSGKVTIVAKDLAGKVLNTNTVNANTGSEYTAVAPSIAGYDLQGTNTQTIKVNASGSTIIFVYKKHVVVPTSAKVTVVAKDTEGSVLKTDFVDTKVGSSYTATAPSIDGYDLQGENSQHVTVSVEGNTITFTYKKRTQITDPTTIAIVAKDTEGKILRVKTFDINRNTGYTATAPEIEGYDLQENKTKTIQAIQRSQTITFVYKKHNPDVVVPTPAQVTIVAGDLDGNILKTTTITLDSGSTYIATAPVIDGYDLQSDQKQQIKVDAKGNKITFMYGKKGITSKFASISVFAKDADGNILQSDVGVTYVGEKFKEIAPKIDGYDVQGASSQDIVISQNGNTVTFVYKKHTLDPRFAKFTVIAVDTEGNVLKTVSDIGQIGTNYLVKAPSIAGYKLMDDYGIQQVLVDASGNSAATFILQKDPDYVPTDTNAVANRLAQLINEYRQQNGKPALKVNADLQAGSAVRAKQEADAVNQNNDFNAADHNLPDGQDFGSESHLQQYGSSAMAENLLITWGSDVETIAQNAFKQWKNSPDHNAAMLGNYSDEGLSVVQLESGTFLALQDFGYKLDAKWDPSNFNTVLKSDVGITDQDVIDSANKMGLGYIFNWNYYISQHMFDKKSDFENWNQNFSDHGETILSQGGLTTLVGIMKNGTIVGYVIVESGLSKPADQLIADGYKPW